MTAKHPAPYSDEVLQALDRLVRAEQKRLGQLALVLDPFAGTGRIHRLAREGKVATIGVELEPEWAALHPDTIVGNALDLADGWGGTLDVVATSPCYGNRFADAHEAKDDSVRRGYTHDLGRPVSDGSAAAMQWGAAYRAFHVAAWREVLRVLRPGGLFLLNVSDHVRGGRTVPVTVWHLGAALGVGFEEAGRAVTIRTRRMRYGANHDKREAVETILRLRRPGIDFGRGELARKLGIDQAHVDWMHGEGE